MKTKMIVAFALIAILAVVMVGCASSSYQVEAGKELVANGNLERVSDSKLDDWSFATGANAANPILTSVDPDSAGYDPAHGTRYVRVSANSKGSYTTYSQEMELERDAVYRLRIDVKVTTAVIASGVRSAFVGLADYDYVFASTAAKADWTTIDVYFRNDVADRVTVVWGLGDPNSLVTSGAAQFDNVSLVKLSEEAAEGVIAINLKNANGGYDSGYTKTVKDTVYIVLTTLLFCLVGVAAFFAFKHFFNKSTPSVEDGPQGAPAPVVPQSKGKAFLSSPTLWLVVALLVGFGMRLLLSLTVFGYGAYGNQTMTDASLMAEKGLFQSYVDISTLYAPFANYLLYFMGLLAIPFKLTAGTLGMAIFIKIPAILADLVLIVVLFTVLYREKGLGVAALASGLFALCPVTFAASGIWGVFVPVGVLFVVLALLALRDRKIISLTVFYALSVLFMQEALLLLPLLIAWAVVTYIKYPETRIKLPVAATVAIVAGYALTVPLAINYFILARPFIVLERYVAYFTANHFSLNLFGLYGMCAVSANPVNTAGNVFSGIFAALVLAGGIGLYVVRRNRQDLILAAGWTLAGLLVLCTHMDMWLILPVLVLLGAYALLAGEKRVALITLAWSVLATINVGYALWVGGNIQGGLGSTAATISSADPVMITFSVFTVLLFGYLSYVSYDVCIRERKVVIDPIFNTVERVKKLFGVKSKQANE